MLGDVDGFLSAAALPLSPLEVVWEDGSDDEIRRVRDRGGVVMLGELHGIAENAALILALLERFELGALALEWYPHHRSAVDAFVGGAALDLAAFDGSADGRVTPQHFALLRQVMSSGKVSELLFVDDHTLDDGRGDVQNRRERWMAQAVLSQWSGQQPVLFVAGNLHTIRSPIALEGDRVSPLSVQLRAAGISEPFVTPTGALIAAEVEATTTCWPVWRSGAFWNFGQRVVGGGVEPLPAGPATASTVREESELLWQPGETVIQIPLATPAMVPSPGVAAPG